MPIIIAISFAAALLIQALKEGISKGLVGEQPLTEKQAVSRIFIDALVYILLLAMIMQ